MGTKLNVVMTDAIVIFGRVHPGDDIRPLFATDDISIAASFLTGLWDRFPLSTAETWMGAEAGEHAGLAECIERRVGSKHVAERSTVSQQFLADAVATWHRASLAGEVYWVHPGVPGSLMGYPVPLPEGNESDEREIPVFTAGQRARNTVQAIY